MVEVLENPRSSPLLSRLVDATAVIVDVLRASTTVVAALEAGARAIIPVGSGEEALSRRSTLPASLAGGERGGVRLTGFDLGNSPLEYTPASVRDRTIFMTTSNGVPLYQKLYSARTVCWGCVRNAGGVARHILNEGRPAVIGCAGTGDALALEDIIGAGAIVHELALISDQSSLPLNDAAQVALALFTAARDDLHNALLKGTHAQALVRLGFADDVAYASNLNASSGILPIVRDGVVTLL